MSSFKSSLTLQTQKPTTKSTVQSTTSALSTSIESHPQLGNWYLRNYGLGPRRLVRLYTRKTSPENRYTKVSFLTQSLKNPIAYLSFSRGGGGGSLAVASGPRVSLYGGNRTAGTSDFLRALKAGSAAQSRRDAFDDDDEDSVDLFGGKKKAEEDEENNANKSANLDNIDADRNISTGGLLAECAVHRSDGRLIAVGTEGGQVKICDANSRMTLRTFNSSKSVGGGDRKTIRDVAWMRDGKHVVAGGDDGVVRVWNVSGGMKDGGVGDNSGADFYLRGHGDKVTAVKVVSFKKDDHNIKSKKRSREAIEQDTLSSWSQLVVSGSYDHTIRVWDVESAEQGGECLSVMNHGDPVQALVVLPPTASYGRGKASKFDNLPLLVSAGGTTLKVWNPLNGSCVLTFRTMHAKTITSICVLDIPYDEAEDDDNVANRKKRHIMTASLDGLLRIHSISNEDIAAGSLPFLHGMQFSDPLSALAISPDMSRVAIGSTTGIVTVHQRRALLSKQQDVKERREPRHGTYSYFMRGAHEKAHDPDDYLLLHQKKQKLAEYDSLLRKFRYGDALDKVLQQRQPQVVIAVIEELGKRRGLTIALSNRDEESLEAILSFTIRFIDDPKYSTYLIGVAHILCDIYGTLIGQSSVVDELFSKLRNKVTNECSAQRMLLRMLGQIDFVMTTAEIESAEEKTSRSV